MKGRPSEIVQTSKDENGTLMYLIEHFNYSAAGLTLKKKLTVQRLASGGYANWALETEQSYDGEGRVLTMKYPGVGGAAGPQYNYSYDLAGRVTGMSQQGGSTLVSGIQYNAAGQMTSLDFEGWTETRQFNGINQMTRLTVSGGTADWEYRYTHGSNNGRITQMKDWVSGEEVSYAYDSLNRLISATTTGPEWGLTFGYDGFGK